MVSLNGAGAWYLSEAPRAYLEHLICFIIDQNLDGSGDEHPLAQPALKLAMCSNDHMLQYPSHPVHMWHKMQKTAYYTPVDGEGGIKYITRKKEAASQHYIYLNQGPH
jgi:hypothetical protein